VNYERLAPAKLNLTLEVLGRRPDGYHEMRSVVTTVSLADTVAAMHGSGFTITADQGYEAAGMALAPDQLNTVESAILLVSTKIRGLDSGQPADANALLKSALSEISVRLHKRIPAAAGLGGGSSDGAAALHLLNELWNAGLSGESLHDLAAQIGSDCPFFLEGGVQVMSGRGDLLKPLTHPAKTWFCILTPSMGYLEHHPQKTARLYSMLESTDYTDGSKTARLVDRLEQNAPGELSPADLSNAFDACAERAFGGLDNPRAALVEAGASAVHLCGAGPSLYGLYSNAAAAARAEQSLRESGYAAWAVCAPM
jgi:4-diphosphocytidyl-2-C-methyl-D-erythritol kinase